MWKRVVMGLVVLTAACTSSTAETTTTSVAGEAAATTTTTGTQATTTTGPGTATSTTQLATTTTTQPASTTTTAPPVTTTTVTAPEGNEPPTVEIISPQALSAHTAAYDAAREDFGANVALSAIVSDPNGDTFTVTWTSNAQGALGTGESIVAWISTGKQDAAQPTLTATAVDQWGAETAVSVQIIVWIPSDT